MVYEYNVAEKQLTIQLNLPKNRGLISYDNTGLGEFLNHKQLVNGKTLELPNGDKLFLKFINKQEGFTVMLNKRHTIQSAGHPKKLLKRTLLPLIIGILIIASQFIYVLFDLWQKNEFSATNFSIKTITYMGYFALIIILHIIGLKLAKRGNWKGVVLSFALLLINLLFSFAIGLYYNTGFNLFVWCFLTAHAVILILLFSHSAIVKYVRSYTKSLKST